MLTILETTSIAERHKTSEEMQDTHARCTWVTQMDKGGIEPDVERHKRSSTLSTIDCLMQTMRVIEREQTDVISVVRWESEMLI